MSKHTKLIGLAAGISAAATFGFALAQGTPPYADVANPALGAGQLSIFGTPMGETGVLPVAEAPVLQPLAAAPAEPTVAVLTPPQEVIIVEVPAEPAPVIAQAPEPAPIVQTREPAPMVAQAPIFVPEQPAAIEEPRMRADRN